MTFTSKNHQVNHNNQVIVSFTLLKAKQKLMEAGHVAHVGGYL
jgi:hypothetical protein